MWHRRRWVWLGVAISIGMGTARVAVAQESSALRKTTAGEDVIAQAPASLPPASPALSDAGKEKKEQAKKEWMAKLNGTQWAVTVTPMGGDPGKTPKSKQDTLSFHGPQMTSEWLAKEGYGNSNFTLRLEDDGSAVWETMQSKEGGHLVFWRGNVQEGVMRGVVSKRTPEGVSTDFGFSGSQLPGTTQDTAPEAPAVQPQAASQPPAAVTAAPIEAPSHLAQPEQKPAKKKKR